MALGFIGLNTSRYDPKPETLKALKLNPHEIAKLSHHGNPGSLINEPPKSMLGHVHYWGGGEGHQEGAALNPKPRTLHNTVVSMFLSTASA